MKDMRKNLDSDVVYIARIINPHINEDYLLKNAINEVVAFKDRDDAIAAARLRIRKRFFVEYFEIYQYPLWMVKRWRVPIQIRYRAPKEKGGGNA
nr:MAG TPA: hypothetical protein [Caudoviricetes sp.]